MSTLVAAEAAAPAKSRVSLHELSEMGADQILAAVHRILDPEDEIETEGGFNSSI